MTSDSVPSSRPAAVPATAAYVEEKRMARRSGRRGGQPTGPQVYYRASGSRSLECAYRDGVLEGEFRRLRANHSPEHLRTRCEPPGAFFNELGQRILYDGAIYPEKPAHLPDRAALDGFSKRWYISPWQDNLA